MSIFDGIDAIIDERLGVRHIGGAPHHHHKTAMLEVCARARPIAGAPLFPALVERFAANLARAPRFREKGPSDQNWRWEPKPAISAGNPSVEKQIEKAVALLPGWVNQVPTASGLWDSTADKLRNIDLAHRLGPGEYELIELKVESDNALRAAMELLGSAALYVASRAAYPAAAIARSELLKARIIHLRVLAPAAYYRGVALGPLERSIAREIGDHLGTQPALGLTMEFRFQRLPDGFRWPDTAGLPSALEGRVAVVGGP